MPTRDIQYFSTRANWRAWLTAHYDSASEIWFTFPLKAASEPSLSYNDAVEEALCFGWIDSTIDKLDATHKIQRFTPRNPRSTYSQANKERLRWLADRNLLQPEVLASVKPILEEAFVYPEDIMAALRADAAAWDFFQQCSEPYKRIRIGYIDAAHQWPDKLAPRLQNFIEKCRQGKLIKGYGGIDKYY